MEEWQMSDKSDQKVINDIAQFGWHLVMVNADEEGPGFVYSVGFLHTLGHPEVVMFGLDGNLMGTVINNMGRQIREGRNFAELGLFEDLLEGYACRLIEVHESHQRVYLGYAMWHCRHVGRAGSLRALQCLWPDRQGRFPDEPECHPQVASLQPVLSSPS